MVIQINEWDWISTSYNINIDDNVIMLIFDLTYTVFSRTTRFSDVGLFDGFESARFLFKIPNQKLMSARLNEEERYSKFIQKTIYEYVTMHRN